MKVTKMVSITNQITQIGGLVEKMPFFQMAPGSILSTQIHSDRCQYELCEVWFNKIEHIHTYGAVKVNIFLPWVLVGLVVGFVWVSM